MTNECHLERICAIVSCGQGSRVLKIARRLGAQGGTVLLGRGTARRRLLDFLGLSDVRKEIVHIIAGRATARRVLKGLDEELALARPNHGIAFTTKVAALAGSRNCGEKEQTGDEEVPIMFHAITTIVEKGNAELVIDAAIEAGAKGGTIINARGSGVHETQKLFGMDVEPEKEVVLILVEAEKTDAVVGAIRVGVGLDEPGKGILFVQEIQSVYGIVR
jgi:nitrogen regulatory protein PII